MWERARRVWTQDRLGGGGDESLNSGSFGLWGINKLHDFVKSADFESLIYRIHFSIQKLILILRGVKG